MSSPKPPKQPDVVNAAREQGQQNILAAQTQAQLNRVNQAGPGGTVSYSQDPNNPNIYTQTTTLSPEQQRLYDATTRGATDRANAAQTNFDLYGRNLGQGVDFSGLAQRMTSAGPTQQQTGVMAPSVARGRINTMGLQQFERQPGQQYQQSVDFSGATQLPGNNDFSAERQRVEDALYNRSASRLDDQFGRQQEDMRSQLLARGLVEGTKAYEDQMRDFNQARTDAYGDLRDRAVLAGGQEQGRLFGQALQARQQGVGEELQQGQFANDAAQLGNLYGLQRRQQAASERGQQFGENTTQAQFQNQAVNQQFQNELARAGFFNNANQQSYQQRLQDAMLNNQARDSGISEQGIDQAQRLQGLEFLYGGDRAQGPQAFAPGGSGNVAPVDYAGAVQQDYANQYQTYAQRAQQAQQQQQLLASLALGAAAFSDRRLKTDITKVGEMPSGDLSIYTYRYKGDPKPQIGVMADEVRRAYPEAVMRDTSGYDKVDYGRVLARELEGA